MMDPGSAREKLENYLRQLIRNAGFDVQFAISAPAAAGTGAVSAADSAVGEGVAPTGDPGATGTVANARSGAQIEVHFSGPDVPLLTARNAELLHAIETVAADILQLEPSENHLLLFDAEGFRATRARSLEQAVEDACAGIRSSGRPHPFPPMNSRERRLIHLAAARLGIQTASVGEGPRRSVVLYPPGQTPGQVAVPSAGRSGPQSKRFSGRGEGAGDSRGTNLPGERRGRDPLAAPGHPGSQASDEDSDADSQHNVESNGPENQLSAEERIRAIRERFRKR